MSVLLEQPLARFSAEDRLAQMILGLISYSDRVAILSAAPRTDGQRAPVNALSHALLGVISLGLSVRATLACASAAPSSDAETRDAPPPPGLLR